jgi:hypothetical protein
MRRLALLLAAGSLMAGCGYSLQGRGITTDPSVKRIGVPLFKDRSGKLGLDTRLTAAVIEELGKRGRFTVVKDATNVDAVVDGEIVAYNVLPTNYSTSSDSGGQSTTLATRYTASVVVKVVYRKIGQTEPIWENDSFSQRDDYDMGDAPGDYINREDQAMDRLAQLFGRAVVSAMLEAF